MAETMKGVVVLLTLALFLLSASSITAFQSDELENDEEFGLEGGSQPVTNQKPSNLGTTTKSTPSTPTTPSSQRRRFSDPDSDSKIQFTLEHAFGDSDFVPAGTFTARLKSSSHGSSQTLTKLRFSRNTFTDEETEKFKKILHDDDFYRIRLPSDVLSPPGRDYVVSSVKARCLPRDGLDEHFVIHMDGGNILAVNYGAPGACPYPRQMKLPSKWSFNSHTVLKSTELAPRTPLFVEDTLGGENGEEEGVKPPERSFWAKYWMYLVPLGLIMMNAFTQAMNVPEEQATGQSGAQPAAIPRGQAAAIRRR